MKRRGLLGSTFKARPSVKGGSQKPSGRNVNDGQRQPGKGGTRGRYQGQTQTRPKWGGKKEVITNQLGGTEYETARLENKKRLKSWGARSYI